MTPLLLRMFLGFCVALAAAASGHQRQLTVAWSELGPLISGKKIGLVLLSGDRLEGRVLGVERDALVLRITKTRSPKTLPKGVASVRRPSVAEIHLVHRQYAWRVLGTAVGAAVGLAAGWWAARLICYEESPGCTAPAVAAFLGIAAGTATLGHLAGRDADRRVTILKIIPPPCSGAPGEHGNPLMSTWVGGSNEADP